jgi:hypothetical protein
MRPAGWHHSEEAKARIAAFQRGRVRSEETRLKVSLAKRGVPKTAEHRAKLAEASRGNSNARGHVVSPELREFLRQLAFRPDEMGYQSSHREAGRALAGQPCAFEDETCKGRFEIAYRHDARQALVEARKGMKYSRDPADYFRLCQSHHVRYDKFGWRSEAMPPRLGESG